MSTRQSQRTPANRHQSPNGVPTGTGQSEGKLSIDAHPLETPGGEGDHAEEVPTHESQNVRVGGCRRQDVQLPGLGAAPYAPATTTEDPGDTRDSNAAEHMHKKPTREPKTIGSATPIFEIYSEI